MKIQTAILLVIATGLLQFSLPAQELVNLVLVGNEGIIENIKEAHSFIAIKKYPDKFERLDYNLGGPLIKIRTFSDSTLAFQQGKQLEYHPSGQLHIMGQYSNNLKEDDWWYYNDTGKHILTETYKAGELKETKAPDTTRIKDTTLHKDEREANLKGGTKEWI